MALLEDTITAHIIEAYETAQRKGMGEWDRCKYAANEVGVKAQFVQDTMRTLRSTVKLAKMKLLAKSAKMVEKILDKGTPTDFIDILSRPNVGVLEPRASGSQGHGGFILSVAMDSLGGVRATAGLLPEAPPDVAEIPPIDNVPISEEVSDGQIIDVAPALRPAPEEDEGTPAERLRARLAHARAESQDPESRGEDAERSHTGRQKDRRFRNADEAPLCRTVAMGSRKSKISLDVPHESFTEGLSDD